jgi:PAS domain S-box-containing protein
MAVDPASYWDRFLEMKRYVRFGPEDEPFLRELLAASRPEHARIARQFYERAREHDEAIAVFQDEAQIKRLQSSLVVWMERVMTGPYDRDYCAKSARIGAMHVQVGLPQRFMVMAMTLFRLALVEIAEEAMGDRATRAVQALTRILDIELALMVDTYADAFLQRITRSEQDQKHPDRLRRYVEAVELAPAVVVGIDEEGVVQLMNRAAQEATGYARDELVGLNFSSMCLVEHEDHSFEDAMGIIASSPPSESATLALSCSLRTRSGHLREMRGHLTRAAQRDLGERLYFLVGRDVTDEEALAVRVRRSEKLAAVGTLAAGLAHEIRNPLNGAQLHLTYMRRALGKEGDGDVLEAIEVVSDEVKRLSDLVTDFLDFARPRELNRSRISVQDLCHRSLDLLKPAASEAHVQLALELPDSEVMADLDTAMIEQVFLNLLNNAVQAAGSVGGGVVTMRAYRRPRHAVIEVVDDGPGLQDVEAPIFDAFYSTKDKGTGLGLSIVHRIVSDHGGEISVQSRPGATCFRVELPLYDPEQPPTSVVFQSTRP